jgi:hypothetical protein
MEDTDETLAALITAKFAVNASPSFSGDATFADGATFNNVLTAQLDGQPAFVPRTGGATFRLSSAGGGL